MKTNNGGFKKIKTTSSRALTKSGLKIGSSYCFRVRAYTTYKGRKYYSSYSSVKKIKMNSYVYLVDVMKPYAKYSDWGYVEYNGAEALKMGGKNYYKSVEMDANDGSDSYAIFNLGGKYSKITFAMGSTKNANGDRTVLFNGDDELIKSISYKEHSLPKNYSIDLKNVYKFEIRYAQESWWYSPIGFGNVKLYY